MGYSSIYVEHLRHYDIANTNLITIEYEPCVTPYIGDELIEMCMRKDIPNFPVIFDRAKSCLSQYRNFMLKTSIFTERGLDNFLMTGRITEIPEIAYNPIPPKYRIKILNELCKSAINLKQSSLHLIYRRIFVIAEPVRLTTFSFFCPMKKTATLFLNLMNVDLQNPFMILQRALLIPKLFIQTKKQ